MATVEEIVQAAQDKLLIVINASPGVYVDYRIGSKRVDKSQYVAFLMKTIKDLSPMVEGDFDFATIGLDVSQIGRDLAEYDT